MTDNPPTPEELAELEQEVNASRFRFLSIEDLANLPEPSWLVDGWVPDHGLSVMFGPSASMKSFVALDWSLCVAAGVSWHGHEVQQGNVVYAALEGVRGLSKRIRAWMDGHPGADPSDRFYALGQPINLRDGDDAEVLIEEAGEAFGDDVALVVVDTMARSLQGGDENSPSDVGAVIAACDRIKDQLGCTVKVIHHTGHQGGRERGHSSLAGATETRIGVTRDGDRITLTQPKAKDFQESDDVALQVRTVGDSLVLDWVGPLPKATSRADTREADCRTAILDVLAAAPSQGLSENAVVKNVNVPVGSDVKRRQLDGLVAEGMVVRTQRGRGKYHELAKDALPGMKEDAA